MGFQELLAKNGGFGGQNRGRGGAILTPNKNVLTCPGSYVCANFGENRSRNATVRVPKDGQTHRQTQTDFIICPMLYAIAMGQIEIKCHVLLWFTVYSIIERLNVRRQYYYKSNCSVVACSLRLHITRNLQVQSNFTSHCRFHIHFSWFITIL